MPEDLRRALDADPRASEFFVALPCFMWSGIAEAKQQRAEILIELPRCAPASTNPPDTFGATGCRSGRRCVDVEQQTRFSIDFTARPLVSYAMAHNGVSVLNRLVIEGAARARACCVWT